MGVPSAMLPERHLVSRTGVSSELKITSFTQNSTSSMVTSSPSDHFRPLRSLKVKTV